MSDEPGVDRLAGDGPRAREPDTGEPPATGLDRGSDAQARQATSYRRTSSRSRASASCWSVVLVGGHRSIATRGHLGEGLPRREPAMVGDLAGIGDDLDPPGHRRHEEARVVATRAAGRRDPARQRDQVIAADATANLLGQLPDGGGDVGRSSPCGSPPHPTDRRRRRGTRAIPARTPSWTADGSAAPPVRAGRGASPRPSRPAAGRRPGLAPQVPARSDSRASGSVTGRRHVKSWHTNAVGRPSSANRPVEQRHRTTPPAPPTPPAPGTGGSRGRRRPRARAWPRTRPVADDRDLRRWRVRQLERAQPLRERRRMAVEVAAPIAPSARSAAVR